MNDKGHQTGIVDLLVDQVRQTIWLFSLDCRGYLIVLIVKLKEGASVSDKDAFLATDGGFVPW